MRILARPVEPGPVELMNPGARAGRAATLWARPTVALLGASIGVIAGLAYLGAVLWWVVNGYLAGDTLVYRLAGDRLNSGGDLYALRPTDPAIFDMRPYGILSPPLIAVPWRLLAVVPGGTLLWWVGVALCTTWAVFAVLIGTRGWAGIAVIPLVPSLTLLVGVGNADGYVLAGTLAAWLLIAGRRGLPAGALLGALACFKLTPAVFLVWLAGAGHRRSLAAGAVAATALLVVAVLATSPETIIAYLGVIRGASEGGRPWPIAALAVGLPLMAWMARRRPRLAWSLAAILLPLGSPVAAIHSWALLLVVFYPYLTSPNSWRGQTRERDVIPANSLVPGAPRTAGRP